MALSLSLSLPPLKPADSRERSGGSLAGLARRGVSALQVMRALARLPRSAAGGGEFYEREAGGGYWGVNGAASG
jgi:hypothetical protein